MIKKTLTLGAIGLALAAGCDDEPERATYQQQEEIAPDPYAMDQTQTETELGSEAQLGEAQLGEAQLGKTQLEETPMNEQADPFGQPEVGVQPEGTELTQGQPMSRRSGSDFDRTMQQLRSELETAEYVIAGVVPLQPQAREQQQAQRAQLDPQQGSQAKPEEQQGRTELILFVNQQALGDVQGDPLTVLGAPTAILVYEDGLTGDVMVGFDDPSLVHIVDASIGAGAQQPSAQGAQGMQQPSTQGTRGTQRPRGAAQHPTGLPQPEGTEETELDTY